MAISLLHRLLHSASAYRRAAALRLSSVWSPAARTERQTRKDWYSRLAQAWQENPDAPTLWCHLNAPSDLAICAPIIAKFKATHPDWRCLISLQNANTLPQQECNDFAAHIDLLPVDTPRNVRRFLALATPAAAIVTHHHKHFANYLFALKKNATPTYLIAVKYRKSPSHFKWYIRQLRHWIALYTWIFTIDTFSVDILSQHGITHVACAGNTLFDEVAQMQLTAPPHPLIERIAKQRNIIIAANITPKDESALLPLLWNLPRPWCLVAIPDETIESRIATWTRQVNRPFCRSTHAPSPEELSCCALLLLDNTELQPGIYRHASLVYIGGGFENRLANILEPAAYSLPIIFGAHHSNCPEALELRECNAAATPYSTGQLANLCLGLIDNQPIRTHMGERAYDYFSQHVGSSDTILRRVEADIPFANMPYEST